MRPLFLFLLLLSLVVPAAAAAPPRPRPFSGSGVILAAAPESAGAGTLLLYQEPGLLRLAELEAGKLPRLAGSDNDPLLAVTARKGRWTRIAYDDAGREGWLEAPRSWHYLPWEEFLPGRSVRILPGMKKGFYAVVGEPSEKGAPAGTVLRDQEVRVLRVEGEWARLEAPSGWFRWRDADGRLTVSP